MLHDAGRLLVLVFVAGAVAASSPAVEPGFVSLFDGRSLDGWVQVNKKGSGYLVKDGMIVCPENGGANLFTEKEYGDFVLRFEFRLSPGANNGIGIRAPLEGDAAYAGMEIQVLEDSHPKYAELKPWQYHGSIYNVVPARRGALKPVGEWNEEEILADGRHVRVTVNGQVVVDADLDQVKDPETLQKHPGLARTRGHIGSRNNVRSRSARNRDRDSASGSRAAAGCDRRATAARWRSDV
jgi:hypothetical protein